MSTLEIHRVLVLSTAHLSDHTCNIYLAQQVDLSATRETGSTWTPPSVIAYEKRDYGYFVWVPENPAESERADVPLELRSAIHVARREGCGWVMFDRDGPTIDDLPTYDW